MNQENKEKFIVFVATLASVGLVIENVLLGWEFWVPVIVIAAIVCLWVVSLSDKLEAGIRCAFYFGFAVLFLFYHGVHKTSFQDIAITVTLTMVTYSLLDRVYMLNAFLFEFFFLIFMHLINLPGGERIVLDRLTISRLLLHAAIVLLIYLINVRYIRARLDEREEWQLREAHVEANEASMEDFLSNISHELRTPVNVVNGMSDLLIRRGAGKEADAIKTAGMRLAYHIEDIQDFTECKRNKVFLEEDDYMSISLINDVVTSFRFYDNPRGLELVVDLDPDVPTMMRGDIKKLHKIFRHLLDNAVKFTRRGGIFVRLYSEMAEYGVNLTIEMTDTGIGMNRNAIRSVTEGMYQENKKRDRSSGGIGLGLFIVYGFAHRMGGFVKIESERGKGSTVRVTIPQKVLDASPCLVLHESFVGAVLFHVRQDKYKVAKLREFYRTMASDLAMGVHVPLYPTETINEVERLRDKYDVSTVFMGQEEYEENREYFEELAKKDVVVAVSAGSELKLPMGSRVMLMPKPLYAYPIMKILNEGTSVKDLDGSECVEKPVFKDVRALIVDDEPMNLIVASSIFREYQMIIDTADSGKEAIRKFRDNTYDVVFMDHMMPEMDGVEAMRQIKAAAAELGRDIIVIALTANAVSGAREMFMRVGFDGFIAKPIQTADFERVLHRELSGRGGKKK